MSFLKRALKGVIERKTEDQPVTLGTVLKDGVSDNRKAQMLKNIDAWGEQVLSELSRIPMPVTSAAAVHNKVVWLMEKIRTEIGR